MKKILVITILLILTMSVVYADQNIKILIEDEYLIFEDVKPYIDESDRTMIPIRVVSEKLGASVNWVAESKTVKINQANKQIELQIGSKYAKLNGKAIRLDTQAVIKDSRTFVPVRFVSQSLGYYVDWDGLNYIVKISNEVGKTETTTRTEIIKKTTRESIQVFSKDVKLPAYIDGTMIEEIRFYKDYIHIVQSEPVTLKLYFDNEHYKGSTNFISRDGTESRFLEENGKYISEYDLDILKKYELSLESIEKLGFKQLSSNNIIWIDNPKGAN